MLSTPRRWLLGMALLCAGLAASAQQRQDPIARLNVQQGTVSVSPAGQDRWYAARPQSELAAGDRLRTDRNARAEVYIGSAALRLDGQTQVEFSELDDDTVHLTANRGDVQLSVREALAGQRLTVDTGNASVVIGAPGDYRIASDPAAGTTWVAVASGQLALYGQNGASQRLGDRQQTTVSGRNLAAVRSTRTQSGGFDTWVAERNRLDDSSGYAGARPPLVRVPSAALIAQQQQRQYEQAQQLQWADQQRAAQAAQQQQEWQRDQDWRQQQEWRQQEDWRQQRQQQDWQQQQQQQRRDGRERAEQDRWQQQQQQQQMQLRAAQAQAQQQQQLLQQQQRMTQQAAQAQQQQQQLQVRQQQEMQLRALQMQQQVQAQQAAQQNTMRQAQEAQLRAIQQQRGVAPAQPAGQDPSRLWTSPDSR
ncbi:hypothetical protein VLK31_14940 [Variovorax sp. H27-G14]